jgi:subtilisin-like proprotein convertase family protein
MKSNLSQHVARLTRFLRRPSTPRPAGRRRFHPALETLEDRSVPSTLTVVNPSGGGPDAPRSEPAPAQVGGAATSPSHVLGASSGSSNTTTPASPTLPRTVVFHATDVPQPVSYLDVFTTSYLNVNQNLPIGSLQVQLNITYPVDNDLTIDLIGPDGTDVPLSYFEGYGANFQNTIFADAAATPISAGKSPFAAAYQPESPLSAFAGTNAGGTWELQIIDWGASSGRLNSWSLIVQPYGSANPLAAASSTRAASAALPSTPAAPGSTLIAGQANASAAVSAMPGLPAFDSVGGASRTGSAAQSLVERTNEPSAAKPKAAAAQPVLLPPFAGQGPSQTALDLTDAAWGLAATRHHAVDTFFAATLNVGLTV